MKKPIIINLLGGPGSGKSLIAAAMYSFLKAKHMSIELHREFAKSIVLHGDTEWLMDQFYIAKSTLKELSNLSEAVDIVITDGSLFQNIIYNKEITGTVTDPVKVDKYLKEKISLFDNIYIFVERNEDIPYEKEGRIHSLQESMRVDKMILSELEEQNIDYLRFKSDLTNVKELVESVFNRIKL